MNILRLLQSRFAEALVDFTDDPARFAQMIRPAQDPRFGDYQANFAMPLGKQNGVSPRDLSNAVVGKVQLADLCEPPEVAGPGFINLRLRQDFLQKGTNAAAAADSVGVEPVSAPRTYVVDFSSPNVAKPMHVGHLRSTVIGDALARVLRAVGHKVITDNHLGDWGTQFGMIIYGYKHFLDSAGYERSAVGELARLYRLVNQLSEYHDAKKELPKLEARLAQQEGAVKSLESGANPQDKKLQKELKKQQGELQSLRDELESAKKKISTVEADAALAQKAAAHPDIARLAREETAKLHHGDSKNRRLWEEFLPQCLAALQRMYNRLEIHFDLTLGESWYDDRLAGVVQDLMDRGIATDSDGAKCVFIEGNAAPFIIQKADGAFTYATTDLATIQYRARELHADAILYVVDSRQAEHFKLLFATAEKWGFGGTGFHYISFGTVMGQDGRPYKTRSGDTVGLESLIDEAAARARVIVASNDDENTQPELSESQRDEIGERVGIGGIKYADLHHNRDSDYVFDYDKMLATNGDTAAYMQYAHARIYGIFRKGKIDPDEFRQTASSIQLAEPSERTLALKLLRYPETLDAVLVDFRPNLLTQYLFELANDLTGFYDKCPVLKAATPELRDSRLRLCDLAGRIIAHGLDLLGIKAPRQM